MKRLKLISIFILLSIQAFGQFKYCDSLDVNCAQYRFKIEGITTTMDYVKKFYPNQSRYISDRNKLEKMHLWVNVDSRMVFKEGEDEVEILFNSKPIDIKDIFYPKNADEAFSGIREYNEGDPFGITSEDTSASYITEIRINDKQLPLASFAELLNPNRYWTVLSVKPIEVYRSQCGQYLFIYIFGELNRNILAINQAIDFSYMAKIVVSRKGYYVDRIVIPGYKLECFGFGDCPYFIGF